ncbi:MAG: GAF domain-containing protein [Oscillochloris sp.]|nr:GAF domain-containing protein [Oscillochloris sp.]
MPRISPHVFQVLATPHRLFTSMPIIRKTQILMALVVVGALASLYSALSGVVTLSFASIEQEAAIRAVNQLQKELADQRAQIERLTTDYAVWDDTYNFLRGEEPTYIARNLMDETFASNRLALVLIADHQGGTHYVRVLGPDGDLPQAEQSLIAESLLQSVAVDEARVRNGIVSSVVRLANWPMVISVRPVIQSDYTGSSNGILIMGRRLDSDLLSEMEDRLAASVSFYPPDQQPTTLAAATSASLQAGAAYVMSIENNNAIHGFTLIRDLKGTPILIGEVAQQRAIWAAGQQTIIWTLSIVIVAGLIFGLIFTLLMNHMVLRRLARLIAEVKKIGSQEDLAQQVELSGNDELTQLARTINQTLSMVAEQRTFLNALHETTLDLLNHQQLDDLLHLIVERARTIIAAPYGELMLRENEVLVVRATTASPDIEADSQIGCHEIQLAWQACASGQPIALANATHHEWLTGGESSQPDHPIVIFPIMAGKASQGVLVLSRRTYEPAFTLQEIWKGQLFSQLIALVLENATLYATAQREIAERIEAEQALQQSARELQAQNAELDSFGHTVAHDLKTPLTAIIGYGQMLQLSHHERSAESIDHDLQMIVSSGVKMTTIINELLLLARVRRSSSIDYAPIDMGAVVGEAIARMQDTISEADAFVSCPPSWPVAQGYAPWVEEVWVNYLSNALKYGGSPPQIVLGADPPAAGFVRFWMRDNGPGITNKQQEQLFSTFSRLQPTRADGHGLGLSIVSRIIERLGGKVGVESKLGVGSTFSFTLPAASPADICLSLNDSQPQGFVGIRQREQ